MTLSYILPKFSSAIANGTLLYFGKKYENNLMVIFDQWPKLQFGLDALSNQKLLKGIYSKHLLSDFLNWYNLVIGSVGQSNTQFLPSQEGIEYTRAEVFLF
jgi:hypothetical protein